MKIEKDILSKLFEHLPKTEQISSENDTFSEGSSIIIAEGFEDRVVGFLRLLSEKDKGKFKNVCRILYLPENKRNTKYSIEISEKLHALGIILENIITIYFNREYPEDFTSELIKIESVFKESTQVYCDISAMSKLLILYVTSKLLNLNVPTNIIYTEPMEYGPTKEEYEKAGYATGEQIKSEFLPSRVFDSIIPSEFSGISPINVNRAFVGFLSMNKRQMLGATSLVSYQVFIPVIGKSVSKELSWMEDAQIKINNREFLTSYDLLEKLPMMDYNDFKTYDYQGGEYGLKISVTDYREATVALLGISMKHRYQHFITIAPFGSKMQTVGVSFFLRLRPETQIVYAMPKDYLLNYTSGIRCVQKIQIPNPNVLINILKNISDPMESTLTFPLNIR